MSVILSALVLVVVVPKKERVKRFKIQTVGQVN